jgi:hypothetical protein
MRHRILLAALATLAMGCSGSPTGNGDDDRLYVRGSAMGPRFGSIIITRLDQSVPDAQVTVNGIAAEYLADDERYSYDLGASVAPGETIELRVSHDGDIVEATGTVLAPFELVTPVTDQVVVRGQPVSVTWTAAQSPDYWLVYLDHRTNGSTSAVIDSLGGTARATSIPTTGVPLTADIISVTIGSHTRGIFTGPAHPSSTMMLRHDLQWVTLVDQP